MVHHRSKSSGSASGLDDETLSNMSTSEGNIGKISNGEGYDGDDDYGIASGNG